MKQNLSLIAFMILLAAAAGMAYPHGLSGLVRPAALHAAPAAITFNVNSTLDQIDDDILDGVCHTAAGTCTLRAAVMQANVISAPTVDILLPAGEYILTRPVSGADNDSNGDLDLSKTGLLITIKGAGSDVTIIDGSELHRVFTVYYGSEAVITGLTIRGGNRSTGGGVSNLGELTLDDVTVSGNRAISGAGILNHGSLRVSRSSISDNTAALFGGAVINGNGALPSIMILEQSTVAGNHARNGGGLFNLANLFMSNSTISGNTSDENGGGILNEGTANIYNVTIVNNTADFDLNFIGESGGVHNNSESTFNLRNTLIAGNFGDPSTAYDDCGGILTVYGRNLIGLDPQSAGCSINNDFGDWTALNDLNSIAPLAENGGPTLTHALLPGSSAIDAADPTGGCVDQNALPLDTDQRLLPRVVDGDNDNIARCDIGAYEYDPAPPPPDNPPAYLPFIHS